MFWLIQRNFYSEGNYTRLIDCLDRLEIPFKSLSLSDIKPESERYSDILTLASEHEKVLTCGGTVLSDFALNQGWTPGTFMTDNLHFSICEEAYKHHYLNHGATVGLLKEVEPNPEWGKFFIRPSGDTKAFNGTVFIPEEFNYWRSKLASFKLDMEVVLSPYKKIYAEYRFFVVDGVIISYSQYKLGGRLYISPHVETACIQFAEQMIQTWQPARAFVLDIASTLEGYHVVEVNSINASGFYACDVGKIVATLDSMEF